MVLNPEIDFHMIFRIVINYCFVNLRGYFLDIGNVTATSLNNELGMLDNLEKLRLFQREGLKSYCSLKSKSGTHGHWSVTASEHQIALWSLHLFLLCFTTILLVLIHIDNRITRYAWVPNPEPPPLYIISLYLSLVWLTFLIRKIKRTNKGLE